MPPGGPSIESGRCGERDRVHPSGEQRAARRAASRSRQAQQVPARRLVAPLRRRRSRSARQPPPPARGLTVTGEVKHFTPVTDEMLRNPPPGDWLMARRNYQAWSYSPLTEHQPQERQGSQARVGLGDERRGRESDDAARARRRDVSVNAAQHRAGARCRDWRTDLGEQHRAESGDRLRPRCATSPSTATRSSSRRPTRGWSRSTPATARWCGRPRSPIAPRAFTTRAGRL